jgi:hypothetical protein
MTRLAPKFTVVRRVLSLSGNQCAFSDCNNPLVFEGAFVGELAHIYAAEAGGPRANTSMDDEQLRDFPNLMYLCGYHHTIIDKKELLDKYPAEMLIEMKRNHEARNTDQPFDATDEVLEQALEQINIVQANVLMNGNQTNIQQNFISQSASDASNALSQVIASTQAGEGEVTETSTEADDEGFLDQIAGAEVTIPLWTNTIEAMSLEIKKLTPVLNKGVKAIALSDKMNKGFTGRIGVFKQTAKGLDPTSIKIEALGKTYAEQFKIVNDGINAMLNTAEMNADRAEEYEPFFKIMLGVVESAVEGFSPVEDMLKQMETLEKLSSDMKRTLAKMRKGLTPMLDSKAKIIDWSVRIEHLSS